MIVAITGAAGFVGRNLAPALAARGARVRALVQRRVRPALVGADRAPEGSVEQVLADVLHPHSLQAAIAGADVVFHLAARISVLGDPGGWVRRVNVEGTRNVVNACLAAGVRRLVHFSSVHALSPHPREDIVDEDRPLYDEERAFPYERSKAMGEREVIEGVARGLDAVIINPTALLGPHDFGPSRLVHGI